MQTSSRRSSSRIHRATSVQKGRPCRRSRRRRPRRDRRRPQCRCRESRGPGRGSRPRRGCRRACPDLACEVVDGHATDRQRAIRTAPDGRRPEGQRDQRVDVAGRASHAGLPYPSACSAPASCARMASSLGLGRAPSDTARSPTRSTRSSGSNGLATKASTPAAIDRSFSALLQARRHHDDRQVREGGVRTDRRHGSPTVQGGHLRVEEDDGRQPVRVPVEHVEGGLAVAGLQHLETGQLQVDPHQQPDRRGVVAHEDPPGSGLRPDRRRAASRFHEGHPRLLASPGTKRPVWQRVRPAHDHHPAPVAQGIERRPPEAEAQVRILPGAPTWTLRTSHCRGTEAEQGGRGAPGRSNRRWSRRESADGGTRSSERVTQVQTPAGP